MQLAAGSPAAIVDWNNNYGDDEDKCVLFHCGNWPLNFYPEGEVEMQFADVLSNVKSHGGGINVYSEGGRGTAFRISPMAPSKGL